jgi:uridine kinase
MYVCISVCMYIIYMCIYGDVELAQEHIMALTQGETVTPPVYNMKTGYRDEGGKSMAMAKLVA